MTQQAQPYNTDLLDMVFENRNREYGAYELRRTYPRTLARALGSVFLLIAVFLAFVELARRVNNSGTTDDKWGATVMTTISCPASLSLLKPMPPKTSANATNTALRRFVPLLLAPDDRAPDLDSAPTQAELFQSNAGIGSSDRDGEAPMPTDLFEKAAIGSGDGAGKAQADPIVYDMGGVHIPPYFPGGDQELLGYLARHIRFPETARLAGITSQTAVVSFVVNADGSISDIAVLKDPGAGCGAEVVRVVSGMPRWSPGESNGQPVRVRFYLPVRFELR